MKVSQKTRNLIDAFKPFVYHSANNPNCEQIADEIELNAIKCAKILADEMVNELKQVYGINSDSWTLHEQMNFNNWELIRDSLTK